MQYNLSFFFGDENFNEKHAVEISLQSSLEDDSMEMIFDNPHCIVDALSRCEGNICVQTITKPGSIVKDRSYSDRKKDGTRYRVIENQDSQSLTHDTQDHEQNSKKRKVHLSGKDKLTEVQRRIDTTAKYDAIRSLINKFKEKHPNPLDNYLKKGEKKIEIKTRGHIWLFSHLAFFEGPELMGKKSEFISFLKEEYEKEIDTKYKHDQEQFKILLKNTIELTIKATEMCLSGNYIQALQEIYKIKMTNNRMNKESMINCRKEYQRLLALVKGTQ